MRLLFGIQLPPWMIGFGGLFLVVVGYARGNVLAIGIGLVIIVIAAIRQLTT